MSVTIEMQNTGDSRTRGETVAVIEHVLCDKPGEWRVSIIGSRANDNWEMKVEGLNGLSARTLWWAVPESTSPR
jgi:hypothetical protein